MADESAVAAFLTACRDHGVKRPNPELLRFFREVEPIASEISTIDLTNNYVGNRGLFALCDVIRTKLPKLKRLILRNQKLYNTDLSEDSLKGNAACDRIIATLQDHPSINSVDFSCNLISNYAGRKLLGLCQLNKRVVNIVVEDTRVDLALRQRIAQQCEKNASGDSSSSSSSSSAYKVSANSAATAASGGGSSKSAAAEEEHQNQHPFHEGGDEYGDEIEHSGFAPRQHSESSLKNAPLGEQPEDLTHLGAGTQHRQQICSEGVDPEKARNYKAPVIPKSGDDIDLIEGMLKHNVLFAHLGSQTIRTCALAMSKVAFAYNEDVMRQGEVNDSLFILQSGCCDILKGGHKVFLKTEGTAVGELELMYDAPCVATVRVSSENGVVAWKLDRETYRNLVVGSSIRRREENIKALETIPFLSTLDDYERGQVADALSSDEWKSGQYIIRFNEEGEWMYLILEGTVEVIGRTEEGNLKPVCDFHAGHYVGELEFLNNHRTVADVRAKTFVRTAKVNRRHFEMCLGSLREVLQRNTQHEKYEYYNSILKRTNSDSNMIDSLLKREDSNKSSGSGGSRKLSSTTSSNDEL